MARILVLGAGVGGLSAALRLRSQLPDSHEIVVFDQSPVHVFWPSLLWLMTGTRRNEQIQRSLDALGKRNIAFVNTPVTELNPADKSIVAGGTLWTGDAVIVALGATLDPSSVSGLSDEPGNFYTVQGALAIWQQLQTLERGRIVVLITRVPFKCPAAPYEAAMLIDGYFRKRGLRNRVTIEVWAAEPAPMGVAGPNVSQAVIDALKERGIAYYPNQIVQRVDAAEHRLEFSGGTVVTYDLLAYVPPHRVPSVVTSAGLAPADGWVTVDRHTLETAFPNVFAIGDITAIPLPIGKPLPKAGVFAERQAKVVADIIANRINNRSANTAFDGVGECFIEMGRGIAGFARGNFYAEPTPKVKAYRPGLHWHIAKVAFERRWLKQLW